jgi:hypothetical protein
MQQRKPLVLTLVSWLVAVAAAYAVPQGSLDGRVVEAQEVREVKDYGRVDSTVRTPDQTGYAVWWAARLPLPLRD